ncbi:MAG: winged helix-turn-helix domain-containing protein [Actinomycetota bacterium]|nr:winged helix-turn-helix domain-containing protein [Actinomycetota bacterium]
MTRLTILAAIRKLGPTTAREVAAESDVSVATVWHHVKALKAEGLVEWEPGKARTLQAVK